MGRKKKSVLNQIVGEPIIKEEPKEEVVVEEVSIDEQDGSKSKGESFFKREEEPKEQEEISLREQEEISLKVSGEKLAEVLEEKKLEAVIVEEKAEEPVVEGITIIKPSKEQLSRLSKSGLRWYQRTGMLPK